VDWLTGAIIGAMGGAAAALAARAWLRGAAGSVAAPPPATRDAGGTPAGEPPWSTAWRAAGDGLALLDEGGRILASNPALEALAGFDAAGLARLDLAALLEAGDRPAALAALDELRTRVRSRIELTAAILGPDGGALPVRCLLTAAAGAGPARVALVVADARPRGALEARLEEADRQAALGILAASVANEMANPLAYLIGNMSFAREALGPGAATPPEALAQARQALDEAHEGAARVARVVSDMGALAREGPDRRQPVDVPTALRVALGLASGFLQARARLLVELAPLPPVLGDPARLGQAFLDLLVATGQRLPEGRPEAARVSVSASAALDGRVRVEVSDTGAGGADGAGGALARCRRTVEAMGGEIAVAQEAGGPRVVTVLLPVTSSATRPGPRGPPVPGAGGGRRARILVVDDEPYVGRTLRRLLGAHHDVEVLASGPEALVRLAAAPAPDVVLCDLLMPGMSGMALHAEVAVRYPALAARMVFITGGALHSGAARFLASVPNPVLEKPFATDVLSGLIVEAVARADAGAAPGAQPA